MAAAHSSCLIRQSRLKHHVRVNVCMHSKMTIVIIIISEMGVKLGLSGRLCGVNCILTQNTSVNEKLLYVSRAILKNGCHRTTIAGVVG